MVTLLLVGILLVPTLAVAVVVLVLRGLSDVPVSSVGGDAMLRGARVTAVICLSLAAVVLVAAAVLNSAAPGLLGLPLTLAPGLAAATGLLAYAVLPSPVVGVEGPVTASLDPRTAWTFGTRRVFALPATTAVVTLGFLVWAGVVADPDDQGRMRSIAFTDGTVGSSASPFPGSFYGVPLAVVTVLLAVSTYLALRRVSTTPALPGRGDAAADRRWREASTRLVVQLAGAAQLGYLAGVVFFAGQAVVSAGRTVAANGGRAPGATSAGAVLVALGLALGAAGAVSAVLALSQLRLLTSVRTPGWRVPTDGSLRG